MNILALLAEQLRIIRGDRLAVVGAGILLVLAVVAILAPVIAPYDPQAMLSTRDGILLTLRPPSAEHWFGTTDLGRDIFSQVVMGTRMAFTVGFLAAVLVTIIGTNVGLIAGYFGKWPDMLLMRAVDVAYTIPFEPFVLILVGLFNPSVWNIVFAISLLMWRSPARVIRAQVLSLRERPFVKAARVTGASPLRILYVHIAPNLLPLIFLYVALTVGWAIMAEASVSFLGFGDPRTVSWGQILQVAFASGASRKAWWWVIPPGVCIVLMVVSVYLISRAYEKVANPRLAD
jgi:peptide/nickel transport system permease protein